MGGERPDDDRLMCGVEAFGNNEEKTSYQLTTSNSVVKFEKNLARKMCIRAHWIDDVVSATRAATSASLIYSVSQCVSLT